MAERFDPATLSSLGETQEVDIRPAGASAGVTIWIVRAGDDVYVRSFRGERGRWYRAFRDEPRGSLIYGGGELEVRGQPVSDSAVNRDVDAAYLEKYRTSQYAASMVALEVAATTMRLTPA